MFFESFPIFTHEDLRFSQYFRRLRHYIKHVSASAALNEGILWRPGVTSQGTTVATWAEVYSLIQVTDGNITVYVDNVFAPAIVEPVSTYDLMGHVTFQAHINTADNIPSYNVEIADGAVLKNLAGWKSNLGIIGNGTSGPALEFDLYNPQAAGAENGGVLINNGTAPMIEVASGKFIALGFYSSAGIVEGANSAPIANIASGGGFILSYSTRGRMDPPQAYLNVISGPVGAYFLQQYDSTFIPNATYPLFAGTVDFQLVSNSISIKYDDNAVNPQVGSDRAQGAIDQLKPSSGATGGRPITPYVGQFYLDSTVGTPIWWDGANWIQADGTPV